MIGLTTFDPATLLGDRLELTLYGMFVEDYLRGNLTAAKDHYVRFIAHFPEERAVHTPAHLTTLIDSVRQNGFNPHTPVFANPQEHALLNGAHRCSTAIQLGITNVPYVLRYRDDRVDDHVFKDVLGAAVFAMLKDKQQEYIGRCDDLTALRCRIRLVMRNSSAAFQAPFSSETRVPALRCYQGFESLGIAGKRPAERRFEIYRARDFINKSMSILDIACNVGFGSLVLARHAGQVDGFDRDPAYTEIGTLVRDYLGAKNCHFTTSTLSSFHPAKTYDCIIATAVHGWSGMSFCDFIKKLAAWTSSTGMLLIESHELDAELDWPKKRAFLADCFEVLHHGLIDDTDRTLYESEFREFLLLRKRPGVDYANLRLDLPLAQPSPSPQATESAKTASRRVVSTGKDFLRACGELGLLAPAKAAAIARRLVR